MKSGVNHQPSGKTGNLWLSGDFWDWELGSSCGAFSNPTTPISSSSFSFSAAQPTAAAAAAFLHHPQTSGICKAQNGDAHHLTCLKLGKRQYYEETHVPGCGTKRERVSPGAPSVACSSSAGGAVMVPRCQVEGCNVALVDSKDYHRRHKVCEMHSKAPRVVVGGLEQRFCQQCSRFHVISEFDDSKRSCRRRLAGHNERRRKSANESIVRNPSLDNMVTGGGFPFMPSSSSPNSALSLLSSNASPWISSDISSRSSAALRELIAENRASLLARQLFSDHNWHNAGSGARPSVLACLPQQHEFPLESPAQLSNGWDNFREAGAHLTLDLMQMPSSSFEILSGRNKSEEEEECCEIWKSLEGTHVV